MTCLAWSRGFWVVAQDKWLFAAFVSFGKSNFTVLNYAGDLLGGMPPGLRMLWRSAVQDCEFDFYFLLLIRLQSAGRPSLSTMGALHSR